MKSLTKDKMLSVIQHIEDIAYSQCYFTGNNPENPGEPLVKVSRVTSKKEVVTKIKVDLVYNLTLSLMSKLYQSSSEHILNFQSQLTEFNNNQDYTNYSDVLSVCLAKLEFIRAEIDLGILTTIQNEVAAEIAADFLQLARVSLESGNKNVAAVLCCAALEDALKRLATSQGLVVDDKSMAEVINALKSDSVISASQSSILKTYAQIRNKALHADWDKIQSTDVSSIIGFTEQFLFEYFN